MYLLAFPCCPSPHPPGSQFCLQEPWGSEVRSEARPPCRSRNGWKTPWVPSLPSPSAARGSSSCPPSMASGALPAPLVTARSVCTMSGVSAGLPVARLEGTCRPVCSLLSGARPSCPMLLLLLRLAATLAAEQLNVQLAGALSAGLSPVSAVQMAAHEALLCPSPASLSSQSWEPVLHPHLQMRT